ncbi:MAG: site-specific recombinase, DNA invertase Pin [Candidatus Peregrinibacteria bacterium Greene0416_19]|nr:MAG: site-specific recombinase, DNA invertase Pin [Candidatus Peregrinibacteria bacterium Greene0416_19]
MRSEYAISILRVSTIKQQKIGDSLEKQRRDNAEYMAQKGYKLLKEFEIAESASKHDRLEFEKVIDYTVKNEGKVGVWVLHKVDRASRGGLATYAVIKENLKKIGVRMEFSTQSFNSGTAEGEMMEGIHAIFAQFENRVKTQRTIGVEKMLTQEGYWCRSAPTGFRNARDEREKPILLPTEDTQQWELLCYGLRKQMAGTHTITQVTAELRAKGFCSRKYRAKSGEVKRNLITRQTWTKICRSPLYGGMLCSKWTDGKLIQAKFKGALTPEEWNRLQKALSGQGKRLVNFPRKKLNPQFPLRRFLRCSHCGSPSTGYPSYNRHGRYYYYYGCPNKACGRFRITAEEGQRAFVDYLKTVTPSKELLALFREAVLERWDEKYKMLTRENAELQRKIQNLKEQKQALIELMKQNHANLDLMDGLRKDFEKVSNDYTLAMMERNTKETEEVSAETVVAHCCSFLANSHKLWEISSVENQYRLQSLIFPEGVTYEGLLGKQALKISLVYAAIEELDAIKDCLAAPRGIEPRLQE